ncbi:hypothetical protein, partial [Gaiella occulta]|uniref:hypothetical protein n=1 Tax=Gaiella occulta TaxID=1002870 RepID=UPI001C68829A
TRWSATTPTRRNCSALAYGSRSTAAAERISTGSYTTSWDATRGVLLYVLTAQLQTVIEMVLLRHLAFSDHQIDEIFTTRVQRYREIANARAQASDEDLIVPQE